MKPIRATMSGPQGSEEVELEPFADDDLNALKTYASEVEKLLTRSFLRSNENFKFSLNFNSNEGQQAAVTTETGAFNDEQWAAFLHLFRPLAGLNMDKEMYGFLRIRNLIERHAKSSKMLCEYLKVIRAEFHGGHLPFQTKFVIDGKKIDLEGTFVLWMNAREFHRDTDKAEVLSKIEQLLPSHGVRALMANLAMEKLRAMIKLKRLIEIFLSPPGTTAKLSPF